MADRRGNYGSSGNRDHRGGRGRGWPGSEGQAWGPNSANSPAYQPQRSSGPGRGRAASESLAGRSQSATFSGIPHRPQQQSESSYGSLPAGGPRPKPAPFEGESKVFSDGSTPSPDTKVDQLENTIIVPPITPIGSKKSLRVEDGGSCLLPRRPGFGTNGDKAVLWANYFTIHLSAEGSWLKYTMNVKRVVNEPADEKGKQSVATQQQEPKAPTGKKLRAIIKSALDDVAGTVPYATDFKAQVITRKEFDFKVVGQTVRVAYSIENRKDEYDVIFEGPSVVDIPRLLEYVRTGQGPAADTSHPKFPDELVALGIVTGNFARANFSIGNVGHNRYFPMNMPGEIASLTAPGLKRLVRGYFQSARLATGRLVLNTNVSYGVFRPRGPVPGIFDSVEKCIERRNQGDAAKLAMLSDLLDGARAQIKILSPGSKDVRKARTIEKIICGVAKDSGNPTILTASQVKFCIREPRPDGFTLGESVTVKEYYDKRYGYEVHAKYPPVNIGSRDKPTWIPAELVTLPDAQHFRKKLLGSESADMLEFACRSPFANATSISTIGREVLGLETSETLKHFGVQVSKSLLAVHGRVLTSPLVVYNDAKKTIKTNKTIEVANGRWKMTGCKVIAPAPDTISRWFWVSIHDGPQSREVLQKKSQLMKEWVDFMRNNQGILMAETEMQGWNELTVDDKRPADAIRKLFHARAQQHAQFAFVILDGASKANGDIYNAVKTLADVEFGFASQVVLFENMTQYEHPRHSKNNPNYNVFEARKQLWANLGLKVNLKMGGTNHKLSVTLPIVGQGRTMVVGYDVTHPTDAAGNTEGMPSLVGLVASTDPDLGQWPGVTWMQEGGQEMLDSRLLEEHFKNRIKLFTDAKANRYGPPQNIIIFRDGVSEGQFSDVITKELSAMQAACRKIYKAHAQPKMTLIVSVKRHHTRFFPTDADSQSATRNIEPGTVVDRGVTQATTWDFFLTAHHALKGTARPAHYTVLHDEIFRKSGVGNPADLLEKLTFAMCHLFERSTGAVSLCPPAYYADLLCTRARVYKAELFKKSDSRSEEGHSQSGQKRIEPATIDVHKSLKNRMFYI
ncbi:Piwi-domain-containing protein [Xylariaceae sp. FL0594]|nr:Piwi-domain-containing protein [Xylariaceae sp. FL0594]